MSCRLLSSLILANVLYANTGWQNNGNALSYCSGQINCTIFENVNNDSLIFNNGGGEWLFSNTIKQ
ncbi:Uncharacterised protein [Campylobacter lari]|uniref:hypothetical protein n=1 Tax=Campylobacter lari TaxID=201 RepID=UPI00057E9B26|nr:hypothetical protein [Campylobacter lari]EAK0980283.1 hypothetical protein [Campylobacter lari]EAK9954463.1 hypothetical protein [Campylobacter lari]STA74054.1 Uncharacterised protein [Campylobacter lari]